MNIYLEDGKLMMSNDSGPDYEITIDQLKGMVNGNASGQLFATTPYGFTPVQTPEKKLPSGHYSIFFDRQGTIYFRPQNIVRDQLVDIPDSVAGLVTQEISNFWKKIDFFMKRGYTHSRGILLYGPAGMGKTTCINRVMDDMVASGGIVLMPDSVQHMVAAIKTLRTLEPNRPILCMLEDVENFVQGEEELFTHLLDGRHKIDNVVYIATTNYLSRLPKRIRARPRRFDLVIKVPGPSQEARYEFLMAKTDLGAKACQQWAEKTEGFSFAHLVELDITVNGFGKPFKETLERMSKMEELIKDDDDTESDDYK